MGLIILCVALVLVLVMVKSAFITVKQGTVGVITMFGKYRRIVGPGLNMKLPLLERVYQRVSVQNQAIETSFQATTVDQANVNFTTMVLYSVADSSEHTIVQAAFKFMNQASFMQALVRSIEGTIRSFVATKKQAEILGLRIEIVSHIKEELDAALAEWGYHLLDLQINDISFGSAITTSMERVVASQNERVAAENEGAALLIRETKRAEAEGAAIQIAAKAEMEASRLRGQGVAAFRREVATGMAEAATTLEEAHLDPSFVLFAMWTEALRQFASEGRGNLISLDGSIDGMNKTLRQLMLTMGGVDGGDPEEDPADDARRSARPKAAPSLLKLPAPTGPPRSAQPPAPGWWLASDGQWYPPEQRPHQ